MSDLTTGGGANWFPADVDAVHRLLARQIGIVSVSDVDLIGPGHF